MKASTLVSLLLLSLLALTAYGDEVAPITGPTGAPIIPVSSTGPAYRLSSTAPARPVLASSTAPSRPPYVSSTSTPAVPPYQPSGPASNPLNLSHPFSSAPSSYSIRYVSGEYYWVANNTAAEVAVQRRWSAPAVAARLEALVGDADAWQQQQRQLARHVRRSNWHYSSEKESSANCYSNVANATCAVPSRSEHSGRQHDKHHGQGNSLMSFYLRHAQCRACVQPNADLLQSAQPGLADYQPAAVMKWCTLAQPKLRSEQSPHLSAAPLADWEGVCMPAEAACPSATVDMNILSTTTCAADEPAAKQSCTLCVLDGYQWQTSQRAFDRADNYAGQCTERSHTATPVSAGGNSRYAPVSVLELDGCPSVVASVNTQRQFNAMASSFFMLAGVTGVVFLCMCLRACCTARRNKRLAALRQASEGAHSITVRAVPAVSSSPSPSAPPAAGYPAAVAVQQQQQQYQEPLLSSGLNPPRLSVSSLYPQLQAQRVMVAQPYAYRM